MGNEEKQNQGDYAFIILLIVIALVLVIGFLTGNEKSAVKWLNR